LETKVQDLQKASETANHENSLLRAQIEKMSMELREYKKRLALNGGGGSLGGGIPPYLAGKGFGSHAVNNPNNVNFQFEFPRFGRIAGATTKESPKTSPPITSYTTKAERESLSPMEQLRRNPSHGSAGAVPVNADDMSGLSGLFSPSILEGVQKNSSFDYMSHHGSTASRTSTESSKDQSSTGHNTTYSSPSVSSNGHSVPGATSSCGTSPEPSLQSPNVAELGLGTIGEEHTCSGATEGETSFCEKLNMACGNPNNPIPRAKSKSVLSPLAADPTFDVNGIDWLAQQNGNSFDPVLFGDYREPQDNILSGGAFNDSFFNDVLNLPDFTSPYNAEPSPVPRKDILQEIDGKQEDDEEVVPGDDRQNMLDCNKMWSVPLTSPPAFPATQILTGSRNELQSCPKVQSGEFDLDGLCTQLQAQAKCSETGAVVERSDFNRVLKDYIAKDKAKEASMVKTA
jgi:AP-1-like factor